MLTIERASVASMVENWKGGTKTGTLQIIVNPVPW
jgi:hypothetical protein